MSCNILVIIIIQDDVNSTKKIIWKIFQHFFNIEVKVFWMWRNDFGFKMLNGSDNFVYVWAQFLGILLI